MNKPKLLHAIQLKAQQLWDYIILHPLANIKFRLWKYPEFPMEKYHVIKGVMRSFPGIYIFVGADSCSLSYLLPKLLTGAKWSHSGIVLDAPEGPRILHAVSEGVCMWDLLDYLKECDRFMLLRLPIPNDKLGEAYGIIDVLKSLVGKAKYDTKFQLEQVKDVQDLGNRPGFYCSELIYPFNLVLNLKTSYIHTWFNDKECFTPDDASKCAPVMFRFMRVR